MAKYDIYGDIRTSKYLGEVEADSAEEAREKAFDELSNEMSVSLCWQCAGEFSDTPEIHDVEAELKIVTE